jgi:endonuclease YncB( thermonuclease family)/tRNA A-37 threonylcarbamoyl transferase component Bud32
LFRSQKEAWEGILADLLKEKDLSLEELFSLPGPEKNRIYEEAEKRRAKYAKELFAYHNTTIIGSPESITFGEFLRQKKIDPLKISTKRIASLYKSSLYQDWHSKYSWGLKSVSTHLPSEDMGELLEGKIQFPYRQLKEPPVFKDVPQGILDDVPPLPEARVIAPQNIEESSFRVIKSQKAEQLTTRVSEIKDIFNKAARKTVASPTTKEGVKLMAGAGALGIAALALGSLSQQSGRSLALPNAISEKTLNEAYGISVPDTSAEFFRGNDPDTQLDLMSGSAGAKKKDFDSTGSSTFSNGDLIPLTSKTAEVDMSKFTFEFLDADTVSLQPKKTGMFSSRKPISVRLTGIDAPEVAHADGELGMPQGKASRAALEARLRNGNLRVVISTDAKDRTKGRFVGLAYAEGSSKPLNLQLAEEGLASALVYQNVLTDEYAFKKAEREAIKKRQGIWSLDYYQRYRQERSKHKGRLTFNVLSGESDYQVKQAYSRVKSSLWAKDENLQVEGLDHYNFAQHVRHFNTDFGSSWDILRAVAKGLYKDADPEDAFNLLLKNEDFTTSMRAAIEKGGTKIGSGLTADVYSHRVVFKHGVADLPEEFDFVSKQYRTNELNDEFVKRAFELTDDDYKAVLKSSPDEYNKWREGVLPIAERSSQKTLAQTKAAERNALSKLGSENAPSLYGSGENFGLGENALLMEKFEGETLQEIFDKSGRLSKTESSDLFGFIKKAHAKRVSHTDLHSENIMRVNTPEGSKIGVIDWGMSNRFESSKTFDYNIKSFLAEASSQLTTTKELIPVDLFQEMTDLTKIYGQSLKGSSKGVILGKERVAGINDIFSELIKVSDTIEMTPEKRSRGVELVKDLIQTTNESIEHFGGKKLFDLKGSAKETLSSIGSENKTPATLPRSKSFSSEMLKELSVNSFSGRDDAHNVVEGLHPNAGPNGMGSDIIKKNSPFGSGLDRLRVIATKAIKGVDKEIAYKSFRESDEFQSALSLGKEIKEISSGDFGTTSLMETTIKGKKFRYIKKVPLSREAEKDRFVLSSYEERTEALRSEFSMLSKVEKGISPSPYGYDKATDSMFMELMPGKSVAEIIEQGGEVPKNIKRVMRKEALRAAKEGVVNPDIHYGNIMYEAQSKRFSWVDFGSARQAEKTRSAIAESTQEMHSAINTRLTDDLLTFSTKTVDFTDPFAQAQTKPPALRQMIDMARLKRQMNFHKLSKSSVGAGLKKLKFASQGHTRYGGKQ